MVCISRKKFYIQNIFYNTEYDLTAMDKLFYFPVYFYTWISLQCHMPDPVHKDGTYSNILAY